MMFTEFINSDEAKKFFERHGINVVPGGSTFNDLLIAIVKAINDLEDEARK